MPFNNKDSIIGYSKYRKTKTKNQFRDLLPDVDLWGAKHFYFLVTSFIVIFSSNYYTVILAY